MRLDLILRVAAKLLIPFMFVFALYVQFHGDYGPGGGFQAGAIAAGGVILYALIFGLKAAQRVVPKRVVEFMVPLGVLIFSGVGVVALLRGGNYLNYTMLGNDPTHPQQAQEMGIILVEFGVLVTVTSTLIAIFYAFAERGEER